MNLGINDTIAAISTPIGFGGIGVVRISGPEAASIARSLFRATPPSSGSQHAMAPSREGAPPFSPRRMYHGHIVRPGHQQMLDEVLMVFMPAPNSYTCEDVVEIQAHSGAVVLKEIVALVVAQGARLAEAGEFTRRAYLNGRIDLSQAEAVIDVIQAKTEAALKIASRHADGTMCRTVNSVRERILEVHATLEADIEFPDDMEEGEASSATCQRALLDVGKTLDGILTGYQKGHMLRDGLRLAIVGKVNVGKSSLLNRLLKKDRAIVTEIPGTTRDHIEETLDVFGLPVVIVDTAGWRDTTDPVERMGIDRTRDLAQAADLVLFMVDAERGFLPEDHALYRQLEKKEKILVINKRDLLQSADGIDIPEGWTFNAVVCTSVKFDEAIDTLLDEIHQFGTEGWEGGEGDIIPNLRQKMLFEKARTAIGDALRRIEEKSSPELAVVDLQDAMEALDQITGTSVRADVLDRVFSRFCIGK